MGALGSAGFADSTSKSDPRQAWLWAVCRSDHSQPQMGASAFVTGFANVAVLLQVQVKRNGDDEKFMAEVLAIGIECDLALLTVKNENFWKDAKLLKLGSLPRLKVFSSAAGTLARGARPAHNILALTKG